MRLTIRYKPTKEEIKNAVNKTVPDVIKHNLNILFCGINPGLYTAAIGHHFGRPGNRFWKALYESGFTSTLLYPEEEQELLKYNLGITNIVSRATNAADEVTVEELKMGKGKLIKKIKTFKPKCLAILGIDAYKKAFSKNKVNIGLQEEMIDNTKIWILPNPSGLNANYTPTDFAKLFKELKKVYI